MNAWWRPLIELLLGWWLRRQQLRAVDRFKAKGLKTYLRVLQGARFSAMGIVALLLTLQILCFGLALMIGAAIFLAPWELETKLWSIFGIGAGLFLLPLMTLMALLSERTWYRVSGADRMVGQVLEKEAS